MFCKWCGGNLASTDIRCKRCGRDVPAGSDCGGFYDIMQEGRPVQSAVAAPAQKAKAPVALIAVMAAGFAVLLILLIVVFVNQSRLTQELEDIRNELQDMEAETVIEDTAGEAEPESTGELTITLPELFNKEDEVTEKTDVPEV